MSTLAINKPRAFETGDFNDLPVIAADIIYEGAAVGESSTTGTFRPLVAGDTFAGFAVRQCDNSAGAASAKKVKVQQVGRAHLPITGVTGITDEGSTVYASDDDTFTLSSTGNSAIGKIIRHVTSTTCVVAFEAATRRSI
jgi:hypothetical protein